jgi:chemotaxis protein methyltransferase CheR
VAQLKIEVFKQFADLIYKEAGIHLGEHKQALVSARLGKRMRFLSIQGFDDYYEYIQRDQSRKELSNLLDAVSTNVTFFYREPEHFNILASLVRKWAQERQTRFRIWSAACSTGEEPYTMALILSEALRMSVMSKFWLRTYPPRFWPLPGKGNTRPKSLKKFPEK